MQVVFNEQELNGILAELQELPIKCIGVVQKVQAIFQQKYQEAEQKEQGATSSVEESQEA